MTALSKLTWVWEFVPDKYSKNHTKANEFELLDNVVSYSSNIRAKVFVEIFAQSYSRHLPISVLLWQMVVDETINNKYELFENTAILKKRDIGSIDYYSIILLDMFLN